MKLILQPGSSGGKNNMKIIKSAAFVFLAVTIVLTGSCGRNFIMTRDSKPMSEEVLKYLDTDDVEGLKSMFCEKTIALIPDLDEQIEAAMDFYKGKTVSYRGILGSEGESVENGITTKLDINPHITDIETDAGGKYHIKIYAYIIYTKDTTMEGISEIDIYTEDDTVCVIGKYLE